jgi:hypothetical protein
MFNAAILDHGDLHPDSDLPIPAQLQVQKGPIPVDLDFHGYDLSRDREGLDQKVDGLALDECLDDRDMAGPSAGFGQHGLKLAMAERALPPHRAPC